MLQLIKVNNTFVALVNLITTKNNIFYLLNQVIAYFRHPFRFAYENKSPEKCKRNRTINSKLPRILHHADFY